MLCIFNIFFYLAFFIIRLLDFGRASLDIFIAVLKGRKFLTDNIE